MKFFIKSFAWAMVAGVVFCAVSLGEAKLNDEKLSDADIATVRDILKKIDPVIKERSRANTLVTLGFNELFRPLTKAERRFLRQFFHLKTSALGVDLSFCGMANGKEKLVKVVGQKVKVLPRDKERYKVDARELPVQFLPPDALEAFLQMMTAMEKDIGKRLYIESAYRSSAYQLYLFIFYLKKHNYSIRETAQFVALPGFSEHGCVRHQALDLINADGIDGQDHAEEFERLPEFAWLEAHASKFGFVLSYPKRSLTGIRYEPWHWRYEGVKGP